ncbi:MAG: hypothetical protein IJJ84_04710, partial [Kiritimatiellae bacterium]|nr:hypothetical protein [Kiritimatiellia bacterium]
MADDVEMTPITPAESSPVPPKVAPFGASANAPAAPSAAPSPSAGVSTIKLKPVIRKPHIHKPVVGGSKPPVSAPAAAASAAAVKKATQTAGNTFAAGVHESHKVDEHYTDKGVKYDLIGKVAEGPVLT